jgi:hypothetical protein
VAAVTCSNVFAGKKDNNEWLTERVSPMCEKKGLLLWQQHQQQVPAKGWKPTANCFIIFCSVFLRKYKLVDGICYLSVDTAG